MGRREEREAALYDRLARQIDEAEEIVERFAALDIEIGRRGPLLEVGPEQARQILDQLEGGDHEERNAAS